MRGIEGFFDVVRVGARDLGEGLACYRGYVVEIAAIDRGDPLAADIVAVGQLERCLDDLLMQRSVEHCLLLTGAG